MQWPDPTYNDPTLSFTENITEQNKNKIAILIVIFTYLKTFQ